jgi:hypothetical protein
MPDDRAAGPLEVRAAIELKEKNTDVNQKSLRTIAYAGID